MEADVTWRPTKRSRVLIRTFAIVMLLFGLSLTTGASRNPGLVVYGIVIGLIPGVVFLAGAHRWRITATERGLTLVTLRTTRYVPWSDVVSASPGYFGITVFLTNGKRLLSGAVQKMNVSTWAGHYTRADEVADAITARAKGANPQD